MAQNEPKILFAIEYKRGPSSKWRRAMYDTVYDTREAADAYIAEATCVGLMLGKARVIEWSAPGTDATATRSG